MRNVDHNRAAEEPQPDDGTNGVYSSAVSRRSRRRTQAVIGAAGLLSMLGVSGLVAYQVNDHRDTAPAARTGAVESGATAPSTGASGKAGAPSSPTASGAPERPNTVAERVEAIKSTAAKTSRKVLRPLPSASAAGDVTATTSAQAGGTLKVVSARQDLTGYKELGWVADEGEKVGDARCSDKIRLSVDAEATEHPTLLICWRTSAHRSVYTLAVKTDGKPSAKSSVTAIDRQWARLG